MMGILVVAGSLSARTSSFDPFDKLRTGWLRAGLGLSLDETPDTIIVGTVPDGGASGGVASDSSIVQDDEYRDNLPGEVTDTALLSDRRSQGELIENRINLIARAYGDSIVLRWAAEDFVTWHYLNNVGVNILRSCRDDKTYTTDTLVLGLKPATLDVWRARYPESDSIAAIAIGALYGEGRMTQDQSKYGAGSFGALLDLYDDQQMTFGVAVLASEWRSDVADHLAMRYVDRDVKRGTRYEYIVQPARFDSTQTFVFRSGYVGNIKNEPYVPEKFDVEIGDSLVGVNSIYLWWENPDAYSSYEIERRKVGESKWTRVNDHPFIMMQDLRGEDLDCHMQELVPEPGDYEYRIYGHDAFGDLTQSSHIHTARVRDIEPPIAPDITFIEIERRDTLNVDTDVWAHIYFEKDSVEEDLVGYKPLYYKKVDDEGQWVELMEQFIPVGDTVCVVDVSGLPTGRITMGAYDKAGNVGYSMPRIIRITDLKAPEAPANFRSQILSNDEGTIKLSWDEPSDDVEYYEIAYANDSTHEFTQLSTGDEPLHLTEFVDTVALDVNQRYIYYKVRAIDYAGNEGAYTAPLQVLRPSLVIPGEAHIDSAWVEPTAGIHMRWVCSDELQISHHLLNRRLANGKSDWTVIRVFDADSVRAAGNVVDLVDVPEYNRENRYEYAMESFSFAGISSGLSLIYSVLFEGESVFSWPIKLVGSYDEKNGETRLAWETDGKLPYKGDWYFCVYRKGPEDATAQFLLSAEPDERSFNDFLMQPGTSAEYFIQIQYKDGRESEPSNVVTVTAPRPSPNPSR